MSRYIYQLVTIALMFSELFFRFINRKNKSSMRTYWSHRLYQVISLIPFIMIGTYITHDSSIGDEIFLSKSFAILTVFAFLIVNMIEISYKRYE